MGNVKNKAQLIKALESTVGALNVIYEQLDALNGSMHELLVETDIEQSMELAGVTEEVADVEAEFGWVREFYQRQLPTTHDLDMVKDTLAGYIKTLKG